MSWSRSSLPRATALVAVLVAMAPVGTEAQSLPLRPRQVGGYPLVPFMEGWFDNGDGTYTISYGYLDRNPEPMYIPIGPDNTLDPANFNGMQPTRFETGHQRGIFTVTVSAEQARSDIWWRLTANGEQTEVPGRITSGTYELDTRPRPHGTVAPVIRFEPDGPATQNPHGMVWSRVPTVRVGELLPITVHVEDVSVRDPDDRRFREPLDISLSYFTHQAPGDVAIEWVAHPDNPSAPPPPAGRAGGAGDGATAGGGTGRGGAAPRADRQTIEGPGGTSMVQARFPMAGEWVIRIQADQFSQAPDSAAADQCCWTNAYIRVRVTE